MFFFFYYCRLGESCSHVAALLFKVEAAVRLGLTKKACTDELCKWNQCYVKNVEPRPLYAIPFFSEKSKKRVKTEPQPIVFATPAMQKDLLDRLAKLDPPPLALSTFKDYCQPFKRQKTVCDTDMPVDFRTLYEPELDLETATDIAMTKIQVTDTQVELLAQKTVKQNSSLEWHRMRCGRITASVAHKILHTDASNPSPSVIKNICMPGANLTKIPAIKWGIDNEEKALEAFGDALKQGHENFTISKSGLRIRKDLPYLGASPDAIISCSCCGDSVVEVKCPFKFKEEEDIRIILGHADSCLMEDGQLKKEHNYYTQVQMQIYVFNVNMAYFVYWTPHTAIICEVLKDEIFIADMVERLKHMWSRFILPELLTRKLENHVKPTIDEAIQYGFCTCKEDKGGRMIGCDNPECPYKWFHLVCLRRKTVPRGSWFCKECTIKKKGMK